MAILCDYFHWHLCVHHALNTLEKFRGQKSTNLTNSFAQPLESTQQERPADMSTPKVIPRRRTVDDGAAPKVPLVKFKQRSLLALPIKSVRRGRGTMGDHGDTGPADAVAKYIQGSVGLILATSNVAAKMLWSRDSGVVVIRLDDGGSLSFYKVRRHTRRPRNAPRRCLWRRRSWCWDPVLIVQRMSYFSKDGRRGHVCRCRDKNDQDG